MIEITKSEAEHLRKVIPGVHIRRTVHKRFVEETMAVLTQLPDNIEAQETIAELKKLYGNNFYQFAD